MRTWRQTRSFVVVACSAVVAWTNALGCGGKVARNDADPDADSTGGGDSTEVEGTQAIDPSLGGSPNGDVGTLDVRATRSYPEPCVGIPVTDSSHDDPCAGMSTSGPHWERALYLLVDRTTAMADPLEGDDQSRFDGVIAGLERFDREYAGVGRFAGVQLFGSAEPECDPDDYPPLTLATPQALSADELVDYLRGVTPDGAGRWTIPAVLATLEQGIALVRGDWVTVEVVLLTAGNPSRCTLEYEAEAIDTLRQELGNDDGLPPLVHVVELGTGFDLTEIAEAGGTGKVFSIQQGDLEEQLARVFYEIYWGDLGVALEYRVPIPPEGHAIEPDSGRLLYGEYEVPRIDGMSDCATSPHGGWWYAGESIRICECTAAEIARNAGFNFVFECTESTSPSSN